MTRAVVDAHVHLWDLDRMRLSWFRPELGLPRTARIEDLRRATTNVVLPAAPGPVRAAIAVQAADTLSEARWLAGIPTVDSFIPAVVLQYDARTNARAWAGMAQAILDGGTAAVAGIRLATPGGTADFRDVAGLDALADGLAGSGRVLELLIRSEQLPAAAGLARRHPALTVVVCHLAIGGGAIDTGWRAGLETFAAEPNAAAKASGLVRAEAADGTRVRDILRHAVDALGADRLMFGSDWPISARFATYADVVHRTASALPDLDDAARSAFWAGTASRCYALASAR